MLLPQQGQIGEVIDNSPNPQVLLQFVRAHVQFGTMDIPNTHHRGCPGAAQTDRRNGLNDMLDIELRTLASKLLQSGLVKCLGHDLFNGDGSVGVSRARSCNVLASM